MFLLTVILSEFISGEKCVQWSLFVLLFALTGDLGLRYPGQGEPFPGVELPQVAAAFVRPGHQQQQARCCAHTRRQHTEQQQGTHLQRCRPFASHTLRGISLKPGGPGGVHTGLLLSVGVC